MSTFSDFQTNVVAALSVTGGTGALAGGGGATPARAGAGDYTVTLNEGVDETECLITLTCKTAAVTLTAGHTSDTIKTVAGLDTATGLVATDGDFDIKIERILTGH